ncbi:uncharacterized protein LOC133322173, partial [Musca vetustissima]|uniref:uncharacterized protein LOC133322173 n=1 Tax=Musca vetustissima TaxID=27455 RepID=UPI002AB790B6
MPMAFMFKKILEKNKNFYQMRSICHELENSNEFQNIIQGPLWQKKVSRYPGKLLIPYNFYSDDIEINNPLGSHATTHSICNLYFSFPTLPNATKLNNIFFLGSIKNKDIQKFGNKKCLASVVEQMAFLETEGLDIEMSDGATFHVYFIPLLILGDNLGLNSILGFIKNFNGKFCRFCEIDYQSSQKSCSANPELRRDYGKYNSALEITDSKKTGIIEKCEFNKIPSFHVIDNISVDAMHDVLEGVCHYDMTNVILYLVTTKKYFSLEELNKRKRCFEYGELEIGNFSPHITKLHLEKKHLKMSAREMLTFVIYFPIMVGDFVPRDDEVWQLVLTLIEIVDTILSFRVDAFMINSLESNIKRHNK